MFLNETRPHNKKSRKNEITSPDQQKNHYSSDLQKSKKRREMPHPHYAISPNVPPL
jgi:hypothetical protein